jgi:hypothetical protein
VAQGTTTDAACTTDNGTCSLLSLTKRNNQRLTTLNTTLGSPFQAGGSIGNTTFAATQVTASSLNAQVVGPAATGAALAGNPVRIGLSDGTNAQNWLAGIALGDGVNGNNTGAVAGWVWNGTTWDRMPGTTAGVTVRNPTAANLNATVSVPTWAGGTLGAMANYGTSPGAVLVPGVNAFVTNSNANGSATSANSSPVVIASDQVAVAIKAASGVFASGSYSSGALASGSVASGAMVDLGAQADSACSTDNGTCSAIALIKRTNQRLTTVNTSIGAANAYETVAASQTAQSLGATGATGDYLSHCVVTPGTTSPGVVTILDDATAIVSFAGGASSVSNLVPFAVPIGAISVSGAWKITTGANVTVVCVGRFT